MAIRVDTFIDERRGRNRWASSFYDRWSTSQTDRCFRCGSSEPREEVGPGVTRCTCCGGYIQENDESPV